MRVSASFVTQFGDKQVTDAGGTTRVHRANCGKRSGIIVRIDCEGEFNPNAPPAL